MQNYYDILNITRAATAKEIHAAYEKAIAQWEVTSSKDMNSYMRIVDAYEHLGTELRREWYDKSLEQEQEISLDPFYEIERNVNSSIETKRNSLSSIKSKNKLFTSKLVTHVFFALLFGVCTYLAEKLKKESDKNITHSTILKEGWEKPIIDSLSADKISDSTR